MTARRKASEVGAEEWIRFAEGNSIRGLCKQLGVNYSSGHNYLHKTNPELGKRVFALLATRGAENTGRKHIGPPPPEVFGAGPHIEPDIDAIRASAERRFYAKTQRVEEKRNQRIIFPEGPVCIVFLGDQHIGNAGTDVARIFAEQKLINDTPGTYVWQMGDGVDQFIVGKLIAENWKPSLPVWEQWKLYRHYLHGFDDKLLAVNSGNHDFWAAKLTGMDYAREVCPDGALYDADEIKASVYVGEREFRVWSRHKWRGSSIYNLTHGQERAAKFDSSDFDIYVGAHVHRGAVSREFIQAGARKLAVLTGSYKIHDDYADQIGFSKHDSSTAVGVVLHEDGSFFAASDLLAIQNYMTILYAA